MNELCFVGMEESATRWDDTSAQAVMMMCHNYLYFYSHRVQPQHKNKAYKAYTLLYKLSNYKLQKKHY